MKKNLIVEFDSLYLNYADKVAVVDSANKITFRQLAAKSINLADIIQQALEGARNAPLLCFCLKARLLLCLIYYYI